MYNHNIDSIESNFVFSRIIIRIQNSVCLFVYFCRIRLYIFQFSDMNFSYLFNSINNQIAIKSHFKYFYSRLTARKIASNMHRSSIFIRYHRNILDPSWKLNKTAIVMLTVLFNNVTTKHTYTRTNYFVDAIIFTWTIFRMCMVLKIARENDFSQHRIRTRPIRRQTKPKQNSQRLLLEKVPHSILYLVLNFGWTWEEKKCTLCLHLMCYICD